MRPHTTITLIGCALALGACATPGPPQWTPLPAAKLDHALTLDECVKIALENDVHAAQWKARRDAASAELTTAKTFPNPSFGVSWEDLGIKDAENMALKNTTYGLSYPIFFWITHGKQVDVAKRKYEMEQASIRADQRQLAIDIGSAYFSLLADERRERATESLLEQTRASFQLAEESFKVGAVAGHDVDIARTDVLQGEADLFDAQQVTQRNRLVFVFALGADRPTTVQITDCSVALPESIESSADRNADLIPEDTLDTMLQNDPAYAAAQSNRQAAESQYQLELRRAIPLADAQVGAALKDSPEGTAHNFSLDVPIPLFDWNRGNIKRARADLLAAQTLEETTRRAAIEKLSQSWQSYTAAKTRYEEYSKRIAENRARLAGDARDLFASGQISYIDLIQVRSEWQQAEIAATESWRDSMIAAWEIRCRTGLDEYDRLSQNIR